MSTEGRNPRSFGLDKMTAAEIVRLMNEEEAVVLRTMQQAEASLAKAIQQAAQTYLNGGRIIYVGSGTSGRIAAMDAAEMPPTFGIEPDRFLALISGGSSANSKAVESAEDNVAAAVTALNEVKLNSKDMVIGIAASGKTPYVLSAIRHAKQKGAFTCGIVSNAKSPIAEEADLGILLRTGPEVLTGSTRLKAGTAQKMALNRISTGAMVLSGKVIENLMVDVKAKNAKLKDRCIRIVRELTNVTEDDAKQALEANDWNVRSALDALKQGATA